MFPSSQPASSRAHTRRALSFSFLALLLAALGTVVLVEATPVPAFAATAGTLTPADRTDRHRVTVEGGRLEARLGFTSAARRPMTARLVLRNSAREVVARTSGTSVLRLVAVVPNGVYRLTVGTSRSLRGGDLVYRLAIPTPAPAPVPAPSPEPAPTQPPGPTPTQGAVVEVSTPAQLQSALAAASPGQTIRLADGSYDSDAFGRWTAAADGTAIAPITLTGTRAAVLTADGPTGNYGLHITGDHWRVNGITVAQASKGVVLDTAQHVYLSDIEVHTIGDEGVHFRWCSADGILTGSYIHDTGQRAPRFGEGVYVGSANSNWSKYACTDGRDNSERVLVTDNVFRNIAAEGADLKEGTESGTLRGNLFDNTGFSGENSADSAVDAKGNNWVIEGNTVRNASGAFLDGFQTHSVYNGYGTGNVFRANTVEGPIPGFGFGLYPALANTVLCDNGAPGAAKGLVGANGNPIACAA